MLDSDDPDGLKLASVVEQFDPFTEVWCQRSTVGTPHLGLQWATCTLSHDGNDLFIYGGFGLGGDIASCTHGVLSRLNIKTLTWSLLCPEAVVGGPMKKYGSGMFMFKYGDKVAVIGGYGFPTGPTQLGATFTTNIHSESVITSLSKAPCYSYTTESYNDSYKLRCIYRLTVF